MVKRVKFERGDIVLVNLEPAVGREQKGEYRPALVLSTSVFNVMGVVLIAPITQGGDFARHAGFAVQLSGSGTKTQGVALVNQVRMLDLEARGAKKIEAAPDFVVEDALARLQAITV
ncbi:type II toxin-antitoxin system ChpB family toxin [Undibacterium oligocarboniphilum]|uniref:Type II toxin-antitoxin system ChpB family toxin n=1 Tax=Undibacterium oligocarboniphilum TaxID=666702 RepID=A0A850QPU3_9BURK|nr:type II toxin-antitoxin system ChpB family toxin [Undibacterium oligocarboniphilum]MBC3871727.1 type II toxin-antitoxin system ChpB family toxin [Undibacterium oligocarboniphilum]NVO79363.1 type II toxin-antitoxin system ChpB family toxin [Undibacterium oligocarboniphilum]